MQIRSLQERYKRGGWCYFHSLYNLISFNKDLNHNIKTKMRHLVVFCLVIVAALAAPQDEVSVLRSDSSSDQAGYSFTFEQSDGQKRDETGEVKNAGEENESIAVRGSFSFTGTYSLVINDIVFILLIFSLFFTQPLMDKHTQSTT